jgi:hypothetical protein
MFYAVEQERLRMPERKMNTIEGRLEGPLNEKVLEDLSPCVCGKRLELVEVNHELTGKATALLHADPECREFMVDRPLEEFLDVLRRHRSKN